MTTTTKNELLRVLDMLKTFEHEQATNNGTQRKRGLLTSIGGWLGNTLGLATQDHVAEIKSTMKHIYDLTFNSAKALDTSGKVISKIVHTQNERLDNLHSILMKGQNISRSLYHEFNKFGINFDVSTQLIGQSIRYISQYIENLDHISSVKQGLHSLITGLIADELVSRELLSRELQALQSQLGSTIFLCQNDSSFYYKASNARAFRTADSLIISLPVPLSHYSERFAAVRIIPTPLPSHAGAGHMQLKIDKDVILYSLNAGVYIELEKPPDNNGIIVHEQQTLYALRPDTPHSCVQAILLRHSNWMTDFCQFQYFHSSPPQPRIIRVDTNKVVLIGISEAQLSCSGQELQKITVNQVTALLKVDCNCDITTRTLFLPSVSASCGLGTPRLPRVAYGYNKLLLQSLFDSDKLSDINDMQYHDDPLRVDIPSIELTKIDSMLDDDSVQSVKLRQLTNNIVNQSKLYGDVSSFIYHKVIDNMLASAAEQTEFSVFNLGTWLTFVSLILALTACLYSVYLTMKLRAVAVLIVAGSHVARAQEIQNDVLIRTLKLTPRPATTLQPTAEANGGILTNMTYRTLINITDQHVSNGLVLVLIWLTLAFIAAMILYQLCKRPQFGPLTEIFVRLNSTTDEVIIYWDKLPLMSSMYRIKRSKPLGNIRRRCLKLQFATRLSFIEKDSELEHRVATSHYISPRQAATVDRILRTGSYTLSLIVTNNARTVTQVLHEKVSHRNERLETATYSGGRVSTQLSPLLQSVQPDVSDTNTRTTQTEAVIVPTAPPPVLFPPRTRGVGRGDIIRQIINRP